MEAFSCIFTRTQAVDSVFISGRVKPKTKNGFCGFPAWRSALNKQCEASILCGRQVGMGQLDSKTAWFGQSYFANKHAVYGLTLCYWIPKKLKPNFITIGTRRVGHTHKFEVLLETMCNWLVIRAVLLATFNLGSKPNCGKGLLSSTQRGRKWNKYYVNVIILYSNTYAVFPEVFKVTASQIGDQ